MELSVIIPIYNSEKYLIECLNSVLSQTFSDIEIICVNDGSTDNSLSILKEFAAKDSRIISISQQNKGVSAARNLGLEIAKGRYLGFVDSDDTIDKDFFEKLYNAAIQSESDVVYSENTINKRLSRQEIEDFIFPEYFRSDSYNVIWNKLYLSDIVKKNNLQFPINYSHGEDAFFNIMFLSHTQSIYLLNYSGYNYRENEESATRNVKFNHLKNAVETFQKDWTNITRGFLSTDNLISLKKKRFINNVISLIYMYSNPQNGLSLRNKFKKLSEIVNHPIVNNVFKENNSFITSDFSRYLIEIYSAIQKKNTIKLYLMSLYSYYRNK